MEEIKKGLVVLIGANSLGDGPEELGESLMKAFLYSQSEADEKPEIVIFINDGVMLTTTGSPVIDHLKALEDAGVEIYSCGACLNYHNIEDGLLVGKITNMYSVVEMINAGNTVINL